jgi:hypothetical protein
VRSLWTAAPSTARKGQPANSHTAGFKAPETPSFRSSEILKPERNLDRTKEARPLRPTTGFWLPATPQPSGRSGLSQRMTVPSLSYGDSPTGGARVGSTLAYVTGKRYCLEAFM